MEKLAKYKCSLSVPTMCASSSAQTSSTSLNNTLTSNLFQTNVSTSIAKSYLNLLSPHRLNNLGTQISNMYYPLPIPTIKDVHEIRPPLKRWGRACPICILTILDIHKR
ncbi:hypothetical protein Dimus_038182 [Dionaea muscipula]